MHIVDEKVGLRQQAVEQSAALGARQVQRDPAFVVVQVEKKTAFFRIELIVWERTTRAGEVAVRRFDLDHVRAEIGHHLRRKSSRYAFTIFDYLEAAQNAARVRF